MRNLTRILSASIALACLAAPVYVLAADKVVVSCSANVDYLLDGAVAEPYHKDFVVQPGVAFTDDFSTSTREKIFTASLGRDAGNLVVSIDYFNDVGVFHAIGISTKLTLHGSKGIETTSGSASFATSQGVVGNHVTNYTLSCHRI